MGFRRATIVARSCARELHVSRLEALWRAVAQNVSDYLAAVGFDRLVLLQSYSPHRVEVFPGWRRQTRSLHKQLRVGAQSQDTPSCRAASSRRRACCQSRMRLRRFRRLRPRGSNPFFLNRPSVTRALGRAGDLHLDLAVAIRLERSSRQSPGTAKATCSTREP